MLTANLLKIVELRFQGPDLVTRTEFLHHQSSKLLPCLSQCHIGTPISHHTIPPCQSSFLKDARCKFYHSLVWTLNMSEGAL
ncbi:hypothetical protein HanIR_Chr05g0219871 [Helianthus annuus]|nr:hypothetical protein HanIR_Chr05g0219871 [Helianthus annuus]